MAPTPPLRRAKAGDPNRGSAPSDLLPSTPSEPPRILIADDSAVLSSLLQTAIAGAGYRADTASSAEEAVRQLGAGSHDLVILDLGLSMHDGRCLLRVIRGTPAWAKLPVIVLTDRADRASVLMALGLRVSGYLLKSQFKLELLLERLRHTVESVRARPPAGSADSGGEGTGDGPTPPTGPVGLRALRPLLTRAEVEEKLRGCEQLRAFSPSVNRVLALTAAPGASMDAVISAVSQDHAIALKLLKLANSAALSTGEPVDTVKKAVLRMGLEKVRQAVLNISVVDRFSSAVFSEQFNFANFWEHSIACGLIAAELARAVGCMDADNAFAMGLLHDVGRVALIEQLPDEYATVMETAQRLNVPLELAESRLLLMNHADIMGRLLRGWKFPKELVDPITMHHASAANARALIPARTSEVAVLALANRLAHALLLGSSGNDAVYPGAGLVELLGIDVGTIARIESSVPDETGKIKLSMLAVGSGEGWPMARDRHRAALVGPFRPLFIGPDAARDPLRIFCSALADEGAGEAPNVAVAHLPDNRARAEFLNLLRAAESAAGVGELPIVVLAPPDAAPLAADVLAGRAHELLRTPTPIARFTTAVNRVTSPA